MLWLAGILAFLVILLLYCIKRLRPNIFKFSFQRSGANDFYARLAVLEERTRLLQNLEDRIERVKEKQDADSRELREKLYEEYSMRLQDTVDLLKETYEKMSKTNAETYTQATRQLGGIVEKLQSAFERVEQREHAQMREEIGSLSRKIRELERDPLRVQLEELAEARAAQAVHEQSVEKVTTLFWLNNGEVKFKEKIGQYQPDVFINNHRVRIVVDEVTTEDVSTVREKVRKVAWYMRGMNANVGYVVIPNAGIDPEALRGIKRTVPERGLYVVRITEYAVHLQVWHEIAMTGIVDTGILVEKGHDFLQILEPVFDEFLAIVQKVERRDELDFTYRQNRYKEMKSFPAKVLDVLQRRALQK